MPRPVSILWQRLQGVGNIDKTIHFTSGGERRAFVLAVLRVHFTGTSGSADLTLSEDDWELDHWDTVLWTFEGAGPDTDGSDINLRVPDDELAHFQFDANPANPREVTGMRIQWTDPNGGTTQWGMKIGLIDAAHA